MGVLAAANPCFWSVMALFRLRHWSHIRSQPVLFGIRRDIIAALLLIFGPRSINHIMTLAGILTIVVEIVVLTLEAGLLYKAYLRTKKIGLSHMRETRMGRITLSMHKETVASSFVIGVVFGLVKMPCKVIPFLLWQAPKILSSAEQAIRILLTMICYNLGLFATMLLGILPFGSEAEISRKIINRLGAPIWAVAGALLILLSSWELYISWVYGALA